MSGQLGFIGLGVMGERMCRNLVRKSGRKVFVFDTRKAPMDALANDGAIAVSSVAQVMREAEIVFLSLPGEKEVRAVCLGHGGLLESGRKGQTIVEMSTNSVSCVRELATRFAESGIDFVDAPVARTRQAAEQGTLAITVGAEPAVMELIQPLLATMGTAITHCGAVGAGQIVKIINNMLVFEMVIALSQAFVLGVKAGVEPKLLLETLSKGSSDSFVLRNHAMKAMLPGDFPIPAFGAGYVLKDLSYAFQLGEETGLPLDSAHLAARYYEGAITEGIGDEYFPVVLKLIQKGWTPSQSPAAA
jgi:3-hydroxyisobutyrate dehydrogenase-like beta-hydroxyacid dehydrogenase